jgi:hypothetical protein
MKNNLIDEYESPVSNFNEDIEDPDLIIENKNDEVEVYKPEEELDINYTTTIRKQIVDKMIEGGIPSKTRDIEVLNNVLGGIEDTQHKKAAMRIRGKSNANNNANDTVAIIKAFSAQLSRERENNPSGSNRPLRLELPEEFIPADIVFEETSVVKKDNLLNVDDFIRKGD